MSERHSELTDEALARKLATELPRHAAPPSLRAAVVQATTPAPPRVWWWSPVLAAAATALVLMLFFLPLLPRIVPPDPVQRLTRAVVSEHSRVIMWGARGPEIVPAAFPWLAQETGITLNNVFWGDEKVTFTGAEPVYLDQRRGVALHYRDADGHQLTYIVLPAPELRVPERQRVRIDRWRPALVHDGGFSVWVWKQGELACFLVSDMVSETDVTSFKDYFARVRAATEPKPAY
jgi:anti-sigma factor RsiW